MTQPTRSILVPLDGSTASENAVPLAIHLAAHYQAPLELVQVIDLDEHRLSAPDQLSAASRFEEHARNLVARLGGDGAACRPEVLFGSPGPVLVETANERALAVVLASHGRGGFSALFLGSVADKVVRGASVPVAVIPANGDWAAAPTSIIAAVDGSPSSERALSVAREIAGFSGATLTLVHAYVETLPPSPELAAYTPSMVDQLQEAANSYLDSLAQEGEAKLPGYGRPAEVIVKAAEEIGADLVVMASSGKGLAGRLLLGSTTDRVLHALHRPLLIVPPARED